MVGVDAPVASPTRSQFARNGRLLTRVPPGVTTSTLPVVDPAGTVVVISVGETMVKVAAVPLKVTEVAPERSVPRTITFLPVLPAVGMVVTKGGRPMESLKAIPSKPPALVLVVP